MNRTRWAAIGATVAVSLGAGGVGIGRATISSGERAVFVPLDSPCRLASTRAAPNTIGPRPVGIGADETYTLDGWGTEGECTLPSGTAALALNVTAVNASAQTNLRFFPADAPVPDTANLNPTPGAAPTPNAVDVNLDAAGRFSVFNKFGVVEVVIDVIGYYQDHHHDDRYYTRDELGGLVEPDAIEISPAEMRPTAEGSAWSRGLLWTRVPSASSECLEFPVDVASGRSINEVRVTYSNTSGASADLAVTVFGLTNRAGALNPGSLHSAVQDDVSVDVSPASMIEERSWPPKTDNVVRDGYHYAGTVCTADALAITGARIILGDG